MSKERLEKIINHRNLPNGLANPDVFVPDIKQPIEIMRKHDVDWLIQQAEKSEELQAKAEELEKQYSTRLGKFLKIQEEKKRYKEALEFYANPQIWKEGKLITDNRYEMPLAYNDNGEKAQQALKGESE